MLQAWQRRLLSCMTWLERVRDMAKHKIETTKIDAQIGANLARLRKLRGMSREELGETLTTPITHQAVSKYEQGKTRIPSSSLAEFARALNVKVADLFAGIDDLLRGGEASAAPVLDRQGEKLMRDYQQLNDPAHQALLANMAHALVLELTNNFRKVNP